MTESCLIGFDNRIAAAAVSAGSAVDGMGAEKVQNRDLWDVWRSAGLTPAQTTLTAVFPGVVTVKLFGIFALNASTAATWRITAKLDGVEVYDSGEIELGPIIVAMADREWEDDNFWTGQMTELGSVGAVSACTQRWAACAATASRSPSPTPTIPMGIWRLAACSSAMFCSRR